MGEIFNTELKRIKEISAYNKSRAYSMLDDMATAYLSTDFNGLDKSLLAVKTTKKLLRSMGYSKSEIQDYLLEHSYITKTRIRKLRIESIYNEDCTIRKEVENVPMYAETSKPIDIIIDTLKSRPELLSALKRRVNKGTLSDYYHVTSPVLLQNFYDKHKDLFNV